MPRCRQPVAEMPTFRKPGDESRHLLPKSRHLCLHLGSAVRISKCSAAAALKN